MAVNVFSSNTYYKRIYRYDGFTTSVLSNLYIGVDVYGIAWDGSNIISVKGSGTDKIFKHNGISATITDSFSSPFSLAIGVAWDGEHVLSSDNQYDLIFRHDGFSAVILDSISTSGGNYIHLAWEGGNLYHSCKDNSGKIYKHDGFSTTILDSFSSPVSNPEGVAHDGTDFYSCDAYRRLTPLMGLHWSTLVVNLTVAKERQ